MWLSSISFLFFFLPIALAVYYLVPKRAKNPVLLIASLVFLAWGNLPCVALLLISIFANYFIGRAIAKSLGNRIRSFRFLLLGLIVDIGMLFACKYLGLFAGLFSAAESGASIIPELFLPIALSFYTLHAISYLLDIYREKYLPERRLLYVALYLAMFPKLLAGPIESFEDIRPQLKSRTVTWDSFGRGVFRFLIGLAKTTVLAFGISALFNEINDLVTSGGATPGIAWLGAASFMVQIYLAFSGYTDMAVGLGTMFGFRFHTNFHYPYVAKSITDFSQRWHISLGRWFRSYVREPLEGAANRTSTDTWVILLIGALIGFWYGPSLGCLIWGIYVAVLLLLERYVWGKALRKAPAVIQHIYSLVLLLIGWVFFFSDTVPHAVHYLGTMFGASVFYGSGQSFAYFFSSHWLVLVVGGVCCTAIPYRILSAVGYRGRRKVVIICLMAALFVLSMACILTLSGNPFPQFWL